MIRLGAPLFRKLTQSLARLGRVQQQLQRLADESNEGPFSDLTRRDLQSFDRQSSTSFRFKHTELDSCGDAMRKLVSNSEQIYKKKTNSNMFRITAVPSY